MSYIPKIVVDYTDLDNLFNEMGDELNTQNEALKLVYEAYADKYAGTFVFKGIKIMILQPEFSDINQEVRDWLFEHDIDYAEIN